MDSSVRHGARGATIRRLVAVLTVPLILFASACGGEGEGRAVEDELGLDLAGILARQVRLEDVVRDCMKAQGFEYVPVDPVAQLTGLTGKSGLDEDEFEKQFGYGITTLYEKRRNLAGDPNTAIRNKMSAADQAAYSKALYGENPDATFAVAVDTRDYSRLGGCTKKATASVFGGAEVLQSLVAKLDELDQRILADPRLQKAVAKWSDCMLAAGYGGLTEPEQVDSVLQKRLGAIVGPAADPKADYDKAALSALQRDEVVMVAADKACEKKHIEKIEGDVRGGFEKTFREQNADLISKVGRP